MSRRIAAAFDDQAVHCDALGSPFMGQLMRLCARRLSNENPVAAALLAFEGNLGPSGHSVPLRFAGALHHLLLSGRAEEITARWPPNTSTDDQLWSAVRSAMHNHAEALLAMIALPPQTNEIRRSAALVPALHLIAATTGLPLVLSELGASAGLNLHCDQFGLQAGREWFGPQAARVRLTPEWRGRPARPGPLNVAARAGVDLSPFDLESAAQTNRLLAYLWADQPERMANTRAAIDLARAAPPTIKRGDAVDWLASRLAQDYSGRAHVVYHTVAWQYFLAERQKEGEALLSAAGRAATARAPLARFSMESDGDQPGALLTLQIWPDGTKLHLGRADFHGRWIDWQAA